MKKNMMKMTMLFSALLISSSVFAAEKGSLEDLTEVQRIQRLEKMLSSDILR